MRAPICLQGLAEMMRQNGKYIVTPEIIALEQKYASDLEAHKFGSLNCYY